jgi:hypothetical protein
MAPPIVISVAVAVNTVAVVVVEGMGTVDKVHPPAAAAGGETQGGVVVLGRT